MLHEDEPDRRDLAATSRRGLVERDRPGPADRLGDLPDVQHPAPRGELVLGHESRDSGDHRVEHRPRPRDLEQLRRLGDYPASFAPAYDNAAKKGLAVTASSGDGGFGVLFPASATNVIGVGGTTLVVDDTGARTHGDCMGRRGKRVLGYNAAPAWQSIPGNPCAGKKAIADLSADADPNSGLAIYTTYQGQTGYWVFGGTSLASPLVAALYTIQGGYDATTLAGKYAWAAGTPYFDVTSGSNGTCSPSVLCTAGTGWDGPTGRGSIATLTASAGPHHDRRLAHERIRADGRDAAVQRDGQGPVRPAA